MSGEAGAAQAQATALEWAATTLLGSQPLAGHDAGHTAAREAVAAALRQLAVDQEPDVAEVEVPKAIMRWADLAGDPGGGRGQVQQQPWALNGSQHGVQQSCYYVTLVYDMAGLSLGTQPADAMHVAPASFRAVRACCRLGPGLVWSLLCLWLNGHE
jgi:hypothetical protein